MKKQSYGKIYLLFIIIAFLLYGNTIKNDYALDDEFVVAGNNNIVQNGLKAIPKIFTSYHAKDEAGNEYEYRPIVKVSYALEIQLFRNNVHLHHFFNIIYYALCLIILFKMLMLLFENHNLETIVWIVVVFAFIPVHSEVVASLKNRDVMLGFIFINMALIFFIRWMKEKKWIYYLLMLLSFGVALLSKLDSLPLIAIVPLIYFQKKEIYFSKQKYHWGAVVVFIIISMLFIHFGLEKLEKHVLLNPQNKIRIMNYFENPLYFEKKFIYRVYALFNSLGFGVWLLLLPIKMSSYYGYDVISVFHIDTYGYIGIMAFVLLFFLFIKEFRKKSLLWYGVMFFGIFISMFLNFVKPVPGIMADRFLFNASIGWSIIVIFILEFIRQKWVLKQKDFIFSNIQWWKQKNKILILLSIYFLMQSILIIKRNNEWKYKLDLYAADVQKYPKSAKLHILYGSQIVIEYMNKSGILKMEDSNKNLSIALNEFKTALKIDTTCSSCLNNIAFLMMNWLQDYHSSIPYLLRAYQIDSTRKEMLSNIAIAYFKTNKNKDTVELFAKKAILKDREKNYEIPYSILLEFYKREKLYDKGIVFFEQQAKERPYSEYILSCIAQFALLKNDTSKAIDAYEKLLIVNPNNIEVIKYLNTLKEQYKKK